MSKHSPTTRATKISQWHFSMSFHISKLSYTTVQYSTYLERFGMSPQVTVHYKTLGKPMESFLLYPGLPECWNSWSQLEAYDPPLSLTPSPPHFCMTTACSQAQCWPHALLLSALPTFLLCPHMNPAFGFLFWLSFCEVFIFVALIKKVNKVERGKRRLYWEHS